MARKGLALTREQREAVLAAFKMNPKASARSVAKALHLSPMTVIKVRNADGAAASEAISDQGGSSQPENVGTAVTATQGPAVPGAALKTLTEAKVRDRTWSDVGATMLEKEVVHVRLQGELASERPDPQEIKYWAQILKDLNISYGISVEKARLLHNESTGIVANVEDAKSALRELKPEMVVMLVRARIHGVHPGLLPPETVLEAAS